MEERGRERVERMGERVKGRKCFKIYFCFRKRMRVSKRPRERSFVGRFVSCCVGQENGGGEKEVEGGTQRKRVIVKEKYRENEREIER
jgi:hypothetical protein